ncbi:hypothetical protein K2P97_00530 [bacterium]|nr:hypothetical protein [bacterium]
MNKIKKLLFVLAAFTIIQSPAMAGDGHAHGKKGHKHSEKEMCVECKDKKDCKCEKEEIKDNHDHKDGDGHDHGKKKSKKPTTEKSN